MEKLIYNFFYKTKGVVSVFLVIVMVPIVTACSLYVDASRIKLAQSVVASSGDLALNTVLSNFDADLVEIYGLMASAQKDDDIISAAKDYFKDTMVSQGLDEAYADEYSQFLSNLLNSNDVGDISDLLGIKTDDISITEVSDGNLTNPTILKSQIIEFMKYRAPIEAVSELWKKFSEIRNNVNDSKQVTQLTKDADDYYTHQSDALKALEKAYKQLLNYNDINNSNTGLNFSPGINSTYLNNIKTRITSNSNNSIYSDYEKWHNYFVKDLCTYIKYYPNGTTFTKTNIKTPAEVSFSNINKITVNQLKTKMEGTQSALNKYNGYANTLDNLATNVLPYKQGVTYDIQYWIQMQKELESNNLLTNFLSRYNSSNTNSIGYRLAQINAYAESFEEEELNQEAVLPIPSNTDATKSEKKTFNTCIEQFNSVINNEYPNTTYETVTDRLKSFSSDNKQSIDREKTEVTNGVKKIHTELNKYDSNLTTAEAALLLAYMYLDDAKNAINDMNISFETWTTDYEGSSISDSKSKEEIDGQYEKARDEIENLGITADSIENFKSRVNNIKSLLGSVRTAISGFKYRKTKISEIESLNNFADASGVKYSDISTVKSELEELASNTFSIIFPNIDNCGISNKNNPDLMINPPEVYLWLQEKFADKNGPVDPRKENKDREQQENKYSDEEEKEKSSTDNVDTSGKTNSGNEISTLSNLPSSNDNTDSGVEIKAEGKNNITNMSDAVGNLFNDFGDSMLEMRDDLYVLLYISSMFTYDTFEAEMNYAKSKNNDSEGKYDRCTLTNFEMNESNNYSYGNEIEYIIYGNSNEKNKTASYGTIFAVRYALNLLYAISHFWGNSNDTGIAINAIATAIAAATSGIIPAPLTKLIMILGLTGLEAANDISILKKGRPLATIKSEDVWKYQLDISGNDNTMGDDNILKANEDSKIKFQYSDYLKLILMMKLISNDTPIIKRVADVIQTNMQLHSGGSELDSNYLLSNSNVYYKLTADCKSSILMLALPVVQNSLKESNIEVKTWNEYSLSMYRGY